jgi:hypothetical protein
MNVLDTKYSIMFATLHQSENKFVQDVALKGAYMMMMLTREWPT